MPTRTRYALIFVVIAVALAVLIPAGIDLYHEANRPPVVITVPQGVLSSDQATTVITQPSSAPSQQIAVDVAGAVKRGGLIKLPGDRRVNDAIQQAGGATPDADLNAVNLAEQLHDGEKVYVPTLAEVQSSQKLVADNQIGLYSPQTSVANEPKKTKSSSWEHTDKIKSVKDGVVDIQAASLDQLERLPGIGPGMAGRILDFRNQNGGFRRPDDLRNVKGIGQKRYDKLKAFITVGMPTASNSNTQN